MVLLKKKKRTDGMFLFVEYRVELEVQDRRVKPKYYY